MEDEMSEMTFFEWVIVAAIVVILVALGFGYQHNKADFKRVCDEAKGTTVYDGRQYQCITSKQPTQP
jgi:hypothetical protein